MTARKKEAGKAGAKGRTGNSAEGKGPVVGPKARPGFLICPECHKEVKDANIEAHLRRIHDHSISEARARTDRLLGLEDKGMGARPLVIIGAIIVIAVVLSAILAYVTWFQGDDEGNGNNSGQGNDYVQITFTTEDGWDLHGNVYTGEQGKPFLVLVHGMNEDRKAYKTFASEMHTKGYGVLSYDSRGFGQSKVKNGTYVGTITSTDVQKGTLDIKAAMLALENRGFTSNGVIIVGASVGANNVAIYAVNDTRVKSVVLLSPGDDYQGIKPMGAIRSYTGAILFVAYLGDDIAYESCIRFSTNATKARASNFFYDTGILHGTGDIVKSDMRSKVEAWIVDND